MAVQMAKPSLNSECVYRAQAAGNLQTVPFFGTLDKRLLYLHEQHLPGNGQRAANAADCFAEFPAISCCHSCGKPV